MKRVERRHIVGVHRTEGFVEVAFSQLDRPIGFERKARIVQGMHLMCRTGTGLLEFADRLVQVLLRLLNPATAGAPTP